MRSLRDLVETAARVSTPDWEMRNPATHAFSMENGRAQLSVAFHSVTPVRPHGVAPVSITDASIAADYVASVADHYEDVRRGVQHVIDAEGAFTVRGDTGAFVCR
jgi:hypothetical protein